MRNTIKYPPTHDEIVACLERLRKRAIEENERDGRCGDMTALLLNEAINAINRLAAAESLLENRR